MQANNMSEAEAEATTTSTAKRDLEVVDEPSASAADEVQPPEPKKPKNADAPEEAPATSTEAVTEAAGTTDEGVHETADSEKKEEESETQEDAGETPPTKEEGTETEERTTDETGETKKEDEDTKKDKDATATTSVVDPPLALEDPPDFTPETLEPLTTASIVLFGLHPACNEAKLKPLLQQFGSLTNCAVKMAFSSRYACVTYSSIEQAQTALNQLNGRLLLQKKIMVRPGEGQKSQPRTDL